MEFNKVLLAGKVITKPEKIKFGETQAAKFNIEYKGFQKHTSVYTIIVVNVKTVEFLMRDYFRLGTEVFIEGKLSQRDDKPISIFADNVNICKWGPREENKPGDTVITKDDFDDDLIPF